MSAEARRPRILLLHGFLSGRAAWNGVREELGRYPEVLAPDLLGYGSAPRGTRAVDYTLDAVVDDLLPRVAAFAPTHIVGHSMGAIVGLALAPRLETPLERLGVIGLPVYGDRADAVSFLQRRGLVHRLALSRDNVTHVGCVCLHRTRRFWLRFGPRVAPQQPAHHLPVIFHHSRASHAGSLTRVAFGGQVPQLARAVALPVAALHGDRDRSAPIDRVVMLAATHDWELRTMPGLGHQLPMTHPALVALWLREFVMRPREVIPQRAHPGD
jgi:pimeloyl-ACP methyl ester carboxylesterase